MCIGENLQRHNLGTRRRSVCAAGAKGFPLFQGIPWDQEENRTLNNTWMHVICWRMTWRRGQPQTTTPPTPPGGEIVGLRCSKSMGCLCSQFPNYQPLNQPVPPTSLDGRTMLKVLHVRLASSSECVHAHADTHVTVHALLVAFTVLPCPSCHQPGVCPHLCQRSHHETPD